MEETIFVSEIDSVLDSEAYTVSESGPIGELYSYEMLFFDPLYLVFTIICIMLSFFVLIMMWKMTKAFEKIANCVERGIFIQNKEMKNVIKEEDK